MAASFTVRLIDLLDGIHAACLEYCHFLFVHRTKAVRSIRNPNVGFDVEFAESKRSI